MNRKERKQHAVEHTREMQEKYSKEIDESFKNTIIYREKVFNLEDNNFTPIFSLNSSTSQIAAFTQKEGKTAILDFASYNNPGGGFYNGSMAQEEALCHDSFLYNVLQKQINFYLENRKDNNFSLYNNVALYVPKVLFFSKDEISNFDVIVCPAPNYSSAKDKGISKEVNSETLLNRINFIRGIAEENKVDTLILGAFGCGVFAQDAEEVANMFFQVFSNSSIKKIVFAIPEESNDNFEKFEKAWGEWFPSDKNRINYQLEL